MAKGIAWVTTTWARTLKNSEEILRPLADEGGLEVRMGSRGRNLTEEEVLEGIPGVVAVLPSNEAYHSGIFEAAERLRILARTGVGLDSIDLAAATAHGVVVTSAVGLNAVSVAEHAMALLLASARRIPWLDKNLRAGRWTDIRDQLAPLEGKILGILGLGDIGRRVARRAAAFGMEILAYDVVRDERFAAEAGVSYRPLDEVVARADFLTVHLPLNAETRGIIGRDLLSKMKPTAFVLNTARGPIVNLDDLDDALARGTIRGAALDVFPEEPVDPSHPIFRRENAVFTPHMAGLGEDASEKSLRHAVHCILELLAGRRPPNVANPEVLERLMQP